MSDIFENALKATLNNEVAVSENGANMYATSGSKLVDLNFATAALRNATKEAIENKFSAAFYENPLLAVKWLFFARDIRGTGMGERRLFRVCFAWLANVRPNLVAKLLPLVAEYGRFDDILNCGLEGALWDAVVNYVASQFKKDIDASLEDKPISLLAKWLPSCNTSSPKTRLLAKKLRQAFCMDEKTYRKHLSALRAKLKVVEVDASANNWSGIDYNAVPSLANLKYKNAFLKHDADRRKKYLDDLTKPESGAKINASASMPCDIVSKYANASGSNYYGWHRPTLKLDDTLEAMWKALPDYVAGNKDGSTIVVCDTSGSMTTRVSGNMTALDVAHSLAIYFAEKLSGPYKDKFISFSERPKYIDMSNAKTLADKLTLAYNAAEVANTDLMKTFMLILKTAIDNNLKQEDLPSNVLIVSDMQWDEGVYLPRSYDAKKCAFMTEVADKFAQYGYKLPRCVYWNVTGGSNRPEVLPVQMNDAGAALVSGFNPAIAAMVFSAKTNPYDVLVEALSKKRYQPIEDVFKTVEE